MLSPLIEKSIIWDINSTFVILLIGHRALCVKYFIKVLVGFRELWTIISGFHDQKSLRSADLVIRLKYLIWSFISMIHLVLSTYPIFALLHLFFAKKHLFLALIFCNLLYLFWVKLFSLSEIIFTNDEHVFLRILVTIYVFFVLTSLVYPLCVHRIIKVDSILYQKFALWTYSPLWHEVSLLYFSPNNLLRVLTYVCRHCNIKCFNLNALFFLFFFFLNS